MCLYTYKRIWHFDIQISNRFPCVFQKFCRFVLKNTLVDEYEIQVQHSILWIFVGLHHSSVVLFYEKINPTLFQRTAKELIREFISKNREKLAMWNDLEEYKYNRHNTFMQKKCICQYLEPTLYGRKTEHV